MTVLLPFGRVVTRCIAPRSSHFLTRQIVPTSLLRVSCGYNNDAIANSSDLLSVRSFSLSASSWDPATTTKPVGRPKAHTGRAPAKKRTTKPTSTSTTTKKAAAGSKDGSKKVVKKAVAKSKTKAKPKPKPKPKPKSKKPTKTALLQEIIAQRKELKEKALLDQPKKLPDSPWVVYYSETSRKGSSLAESQAILKERAGSWHTLAPEERERVNHTANQNKKENEINYKKWISKFTPAQIKEANNARKQLLLAKPKTKTDEGYHISMMKDDRLVKGPSNSYIYFSIDRIASGDYRGMTLTERTRLVGKEWKELSTSERKPFDDKAAADLNRYKEEFKTVYGTDVPFPRVKKSKKSTTETSAPST